MQIQTPRLLDGEPAGATHGSAPLAGLRWPPRPCSSAGRRR
jgi:hypothetical protein